MQYDYLKELLIDKNLDELINIQEETMYTIKACLVSLKEHVNIDVNKAFFFLCLMCVNCDNYLGENEFELLKKYINQNNYDEMDKYLKSLPSNQILLFSKEFVYLISSYSKETKEELQKFVMCFLLADSINEEKKKIFYENLFDLNKPLEENQN